MEYFARRLVFATLLVPNPSLTMPITTSLNFSEEEEEEEEIFIL